MSGIRIRRGEPADIPLLAEFNQKMAFETEGKRLDPATLLAGVAAVFGDAEKGFYLVAESDAVMIGQLMVTKEWSDWRNGWFWWIQSVFVREDFRGKGIFRMIFEAAEETAKASGDVIGVRLYVERENFTAQTVYQKLGMEEEPYRVFEKQWK